MPYLAAHNSFREMIWILLFGYIVALVLHFVIAELSYNNNGAQFISCFDAELFSGVIKKIFTWAAFLLLGLSVIVNVSAFLTGAAAVFRSWFGLPDIVGMLIFYVIGAGVVFVGMKLVGICEKSPSARWSALWAYCSLQRCLTKQAPSPPAGTDLITPWRCSA